jgi:hypothetical protein
MDKEPAYYAVIPSDVRYDKNLCANEKLLYGEITALTHKEGYCWAPNKYFATLYGVTIGTVSGWFASLKKQGYIDFTVEKNYIRKVTLTNFRIPPNEKPEAPPNEKPEAPPNEKPEDINTSINITSINKEILSPSAIIGNDVLYKAIWESCLLISKTFSNYAKEGANCKRLCKIIRERKPESDETLAKEVLETFCTLRNSGGKFWSETPFTPSAIIGKFDYIIASIEEKYKQNDTSWVDEYFENKGIQA